jgi:hypothetical protein
MPQFYDSRSETGPEESVLLNPAGELFSHFLWRADTQSGFDKPS